MVPSQHSAAAQGICDKRLLIEAELHDPRPTDATSDPAEMGGNPLPPTRRNRNRSSARAAKASSSSDGPSDEATALEIFALSTVHAIAIGEKRPFP